MAVFFDISWNGMGGIGRFANEISKRLIAINKRFSKNPASPFAIILNSRLYFTKNAELLLFPGYIPPLFSKSPYIITIHDLNHLDRKENSSFLKKIFYELVIKNGIHRAEKILTVSEFSRKKIIEWSNVSPEKVINVWNGVDSIFNPSGVRYNSGCGYLLCVSNRKLHKNEPFLINAFSRSNIDKSIKLFFTGSSTDELNELIYRLNLTDRVVFHGNIPEQDLPALYRGALALTFPSLYEGFGLPVIEAMACGIPVLTSNTTSLPEVAGDAAILVNPESIDDIKAGIEKIVLDQALRKELVVKGLDRAKLFSWDDVAARVQAIINEVTERHAG